MGDCDEVDVFVDAFERPGVLFERPGVLFEEPGVVLEGPGVLFEELGVVFEDLGVVFEDFGVLLAKAFEGADPFRELHNSLSVFVDFLEELCSDTVDFFEEHPSGLANLVGERHQLLILSIQALVDAIEALIDAIEALIDAIEALIDAIEALVEMFEELFHLDIVHFLLSI